MERFDFLSKAGDIHKNVQEYVKNNVASGMKLVDLANLIENKIALEVKQFDPTRNMINRGIAFPTGLSTNHCAAHWTPNSPLEYNLTIDENDIVKIDFGVHLNGHIIDGAFSYCSTDRFKDLIQVSEEATDCGIKSAGADAILGEIGANIQEVIENSQVEIDGKIINVKSVVDICGHNITQYKIHAGKAVPNIKIPYPVRMEEGEQYAIETFPSTGSGRVWGDDKNCSHFMIYNPVPTKLSGDEQKAFKSIKETYSTLAFCKRWNPDIFNPTFDKLVKKEQIQTYPPLYDKKGSFIAQTEKSILITSSGIKILN